MVRLVCLSGYRLQNATPQMWAGLRMRVEKYLPLMQNMVPGFYFDDADLAIPPIDRLMAKLYHGEIYLAFSNQHDTIESFIGLAAITDIERGRSGYLEGIANGASYSPLHIGKAMGEIVAYAFKPFNNDLSGLGLQKLKAGVIEGNMRVVRMLAKAGFEPCARFRAEVLHSGIPKDKIVLELLNPMIFGQAQVITNAISPQSTQLPADDLPPSASSADLRGGTASTIHSEPEWSEGGEPSPAGNGVGAELVEPEQLRRDREPIFTEREGWTLRPESDTADEQLLHAESGAASSSGGAVGGSGFGAKLRQLWGG